MSNTKQRIYSAIVLILVVAMALFLGPMVCIGVVLALGLLMVDELYCNFLKRKRFDTHYFIAQGILLLPFLYMNYWDPSLYPNYVVVDLALALDTALLYYLFFVPMESKSVVEIGKRWPFLVGFFVLVFFISMTVVFHYSKWKEFLIMLLFVTYGMDTGAWFIGKKFGKQKLWPQVSPNKTVEGLIGGAILSGILGGLFWISIFGKIGIRPFLFFMFLGIMSQVGDLIQSKLKRQFDLKDSSSLIPGHGGVYDRLDGLCFLSPFYALVIKYFYL